MKTARTTYYHKFIEDSSSNQRTLFKASKQLLNLKQNPVFSDRSTSESQKLANEIGTFFIQKIENFRSKLDNITSPNDSHISYSDPPNKTNIVMEKFELLTETQILDLINSMPKKTCALDPFQQTC